MKKWLLIFLLLFATAVAQEGKPTLVLNATAITGNGSRIENSAVAFQNGRFTLVGDATRIRLDLGKYHVVDAYGQYLYPLSMAGTLKGLPKQLNDSVIEVGLEASFALSVSPPCGRADSTTVVYIKGLKEINAK